MNNANQYLEDETIKTLKSTLLMLYIEQGLLYEKGIKKTSKYFAHPIFRAKISQPSN